MRHIAVFNNSLDVLIELREIYSISVYKLSSFSLFHFSSNVAADVDHKWAKHFFTSLFQFLLLAIPIKILIKKIMQTAHSPKPSISKMSMTFVNHCFPLLTLKLKSTSLETILTLLITICFRPRYVFNYHGPLLKKLQCFIYIFSLQID